MQFTCNRLALSAKLNFVQKAINNKVTLSILKNVYIKAENDTIRLIGYDLEVGLRTEFQANVTKEGSILVDYRLFSDIVKKAPEDLMTFTVENGLMKIKSGKYKPSLKVDDASSYPSLPEINLENCFELESNKLKKASKEVLVSISQDQTKPVLMGVLMELGKDKVSFSSIDGYRLTSNYLELDPVEDDTIVKRIVPGKVLGDLVSLLPNDDSEVKIDFDDKYIMFENDNFQLTTRLIHGDFVDCKKLIPKEHNTVVRINKEDFQGAIERASLISQSEKNNLVKFQIRDGVLSVLCSCDNGDNEEELDIELEGDFLDIAFNSRYMLEALKTIDVKEIKLCFTSNVNPMIFVIEDRKDYVHLLLPVRLSSSNF